jgi:hypothetical protein
LKIESKQIYTFKPKLWEGYSIIYYKKK